MTEPAWDGKADELQEISQPTLEDILKTKFGKKK
jgi:hypothetical protein